MSFSGWPSIDSQPASKAVREYLRSTLLSVRQNPISDSFQLVLDIAAGRRVLDVGAVGHNEHSEVSVNWKHRLLANASSYCLGIDIVEPSVDYLQQKGYNIQLCDATSELYLGRRFDIIFAGDVIEHVDSPHLLMSFVRRHLEPNGKFFVSTPNPFFVGNLKTLSADSLFLANAEHVSWITPTCALEIARRSQMILSSYWHVHDLRAGFTKQFITRLLSSVGFYECEFLARSFLYEFSLYDS